MEESKVIPKPKLIVIGGSAGSLQVILRLLEQLDQSFNIPILLVLHRDPQGSSRLNDILSIRTRMTVKEIEDKDLIEPGHLYVCPADYHVLIEDDQSFSLDYSEKEHFSRPSIDVAFKASADVFKDSLLCILLSGANADGAEGLSYAKLRGSTTIIQHPEDAMVSYMPEQAILQHKADYVVNARSILEYLNKI